jgi:hypothetical protein
MPQNDEKCKKFHYGIKFIFLCDADCCVMSLLYEYMFKDVWQHNSIC